MPGLWENWKALQPSRSFSWSANSDFRSMPGLWQVRLHLPQSFTSQQVHLL